MEHLRPNPIDVDSVLARLRSDILSGFSTNYVTVRPEIRGAVTTDPETGRKFQDADAATARVWMFVIGEPSLP